MHGTGNPGFCCKNNNLQGDRDELGPDKSGRRSGSGSGS